MAGTVGDRVYQIRQALGPNARRPMSQDAFADALTQRGARRYYGPEISLIESGKKALTLDDVETIAAMDPERRGKLWLGWGESVDATMHPPREEPAHVEPEPEPIAKPASATIDRKRRARGST